MFRGVILASLSFALAAFSLTITSDPTVVAKKTFTHVIVGGGTAGLTVASRLAEIPIFKILVIEAGPDKHDDPIINNPGTVSDAAGAFGWFYNTTPQAVGGLSQVIPQGKVLGGSSAINGMQWTRGTLDQYDALEKLGNPGWNAKTLFKYMKKTENFHPPNAKQRQLGATYNPLYHGRGGPISVSYPQPYLATQSWKAYENASFATFPTAKRNIDLGTGKPNGVARFFYSLFPGTTDAPGGNKRCSSAEGYIYPYVNTTKKSNLVVLVDHQASGIKWYGGWGPARAIGVKFIPTGNKSVEYSVKLTREVIVAAGALGSPAFLELSGIGDPKILKSVGIPVKVSLPSVGTNLQDQPLTYNLYAANPALDPDVTNSTNVVIQGAVGFHDIKTILGPIKGLLAATKLLKTVDSRAKAIVATGGYTSVKGLKKVLKYQAESILYKNAPVIEMSFSVNLVPGVFGHLVWNLLPQVRGTVHIKSSDPTVLPAVDPKYLTTQFELELQSNATKLSRKIFRQPSLAALTVAEVSPGPSVTDDASDAVWQGFVSSAYGPVIHPVGSVPMLPREDGGAVGPDLKVYGTRNVRVVDSSILPIQISAHLSGTVYGVAERAADIIKYGH